MSTKLGLKDITIVPAVVSNIEHRSDCSPYVNINYNPCSNNNMLPLIASPMAAVLNETNYKIFNENGIFTVIPRTINLDKRVDLIFDTFVAFGLNEVIDIFINRNDYFKKIMNAIEYENKHRCYICIDIANGHMKKLLDVIKTIKDAYGDTVIVMAGNIANPETYKQYAIAGCDYVRAGIGVGSACFVKNTKIKTVGGEKNIQDITTNDYVYTHTGKIQHVLAVSSIPYSGELIKINETVCTPDHKFYVIDKNDKCKINNESDISKYAYWIEAQQLNKEKHLLIQLE